MLGALYCNVGWQDFPESLKFQNVKTFSYSLGPKNYRNLKFSKIAERLALPNRDWNLFTINSWNLKVQIRCESILQIQKRNNLLNLTNMKATSGLDPQVQVMLNSGSLSIQGVIYELYHREQVFHNCLHCLHPCERAWALSTWVSIAAKSLYTDPFKILKPQNFLTYRFNQNKPSGA